MAAVTDDNASNREQVFCFIVEYKRQHDGLSPGIKEIAEGCALSESTVRYHLLVLEIEDRIRVVSRRGIEVIGGVWDWPEEG